MKHLILTIAFAVSLLVSGCEVQSGITQKELEKFKPSPTPVIKVPTPEPIDPTDVITLDAAVSGPNVNINKPEEGKNAKCAKYNKVMVNGDGKEVKIDGACKQIMINGDGNKVTVTAVSEIVINGTENSVEYHKYINGKHTIVNDNAGSSTVSRVPMPAASPKPGK